MGSLLWLTRGTRPDLAFPVTYLAQFSNCYGEVHFKAAMRVLEYAYNTKLRQLVFVKTHTRQSA